MPHPHRRWAAWVFLLIAASFATRAGALDRVVAPPNCNETGFAGALAAVDASGGGKVTFNCGNTIIYFTSYKSIANAVTIDGGWQISMDAANTSAFFQVYASANVTLTRLNLMDGAYAGAHAIENFGTLRLDNVRFSNNVSTQSTVMNYGRLTVSRTSFFQSKATAPTAKGGAIAHEGSALTVVASAFIKNSAANGGAIHSSGPLVIRNSTFNGNSASGGGAIYQTGSTAEVTYAAIVGNSALYGAGIYNDGTASGTLTIGKSVVAANATGNCDGVIASAGYNLSDGTSCGGAFTATGDLVGQTLPFLPLVLGDLNVTSHLIPAAGSPAIDHVPRALCAAIADQRNAVRPAGAGCDSGAVEVNGALDRVFADGFEGDG